MTKNEILDQIVADRNGYLLTADALACSISKHTLAAYVARNEMVRTAHGIYISKDVWEDDYYLLYLRNRKIVFSFETALYLHNLMDREPSVTTVTVPQGYNSTHITGIRVIHSKWPALGVTEIKTNYGNTVPVYDRERTICDIIRNRKKVEIQTYQTAIKGYMSSREKRLDHLMKYAKTLGIEEKLRRYTEVML